MNIIILSALGDLMPAGIGGADVKRFKWLHRIDGGPEAFETPDAKGESDGPVLLGGWFSRKGGGGESTTTGIDLLTLDTSLESILIGGGKIPRRISSAGTAPTDITLSNSEIDENSSGGTVVGRLGAIDSDRKERFTFTLLDDADGRFAITSGNRLIVTNGAELDYEAQPAHDILVQVTDRRGNVYSETITINLRDLTENVNIAPTAVTLSHTAIDENSDARTVIGTLGTDDPDADDIWTYEITSDPDQKFQIVAGQLVLRDGASLDHETQASHSVTVQVTDSFGASHSQTFVISVNDVPEPVNQAPTDLLLSSNTVAEGAAFGTLVGQLSAIDPDSGETFTYTLLDNAGGRFVLNGNRLEVADGSQIDYELQDTHNVTVRVTDSEDNSYTETFSIGVQDMAENLTDQPDYVQALVPAVGGEAYYFWPDAQPSTAPVTITFSILTGFPSYYNSSTLPYTDYTAGSVPFTQLTSAQVTAIQQILAEVEDFANVDFVQVGSAAEANLTFGAYFMDAGIGAYAYFASPSGSTGSRAGDVWFNSRYDSTPSISETGSADWARTIIAHELGHALGMKHPGDYDAGGGGSDGPYLDPAFDSAQYTVMSYTDFPNSSWNPVDYQVYDIASLQYLYGANTAHATGDDVYQFSTSQNLIDTIWDAGGFDTFSAAGASTGVVIDLNPGGFSSIGIQNNIAIAYGTWIEAAVGGSGADRIVGNVLDNTFTGGGGADHFVFDLGWGDDSITDFQNGLDLLDFSGSGFLFDDFDIAAGTTGAEISAGGSTLLLSGIQISQVDESDFVFV